MADVYQIHNRKGFLSQFTLTTKIIFFNVLVYILILILSAIYGQEKIIQYVAITPALVISGKYLWTFLTSMFVHFEFFHIFANMFSLYFVGLFLEKIIGRKRFFWVYIIAGLMGGVFYVGACLIFGGMNIPAVGASGAIFGLLGVLAVIVPHSRIYMIVGPLVLIVLEVVFQNVLPASAFSIIDPVINVLFIVMIISMFSAGKLRKVSIPVELPMWCLPIAAIIPLSIIGLFVALPIGNSAHLGGLVVGLIYGFYLRKKFPTKTKKIRQMFR